MDWIITHGLVFLAGLCIGWWVLDCPAWLAKRLPWTRTPPIILIVGLLFLAGCTGLHKISELPTDPGFYDLTGEYVSAPAANTRFMVTDAGEIVWLQDKTQWDHSLGAAVVGTATGWAHEAIRGPDEYHQTNTQTGGGGTGGTGTGGAGGDAKQGQAQGQEQQQKQDQNADANSGKYGKGK